MRVVHPRPLLRCWLDDPPSYTLELDEQLPINMPFLVKYLQKLETSYKSPSEVPFHNMTHAADVVQGTAYFAIVWVITTLCWIPLAFYAVVLSYAHAPRSIPRRRPPDR